MNDAYAPTPRLRWVKKRAAPARGTIGTRMVDALSGLPPGTTPVPAGTTVVTLPVLEQWWAPAVADYMRGSEGEWREVEVVGGL